MNTWLLNVHVHNYHLTINVCFIYSQQIKISVKSKTMTTKNTFPDLSQNCCSWVWNEESLQQNCIQLSITSPKTHLLHRQTQLLHFLIPASVLWPLIPDCVPFFRPTIVWGRSLLLLTFFTYLWRHAALISRYLKKRHDFSFNFTLLALIYCPFHADEGKLQPLYHSDAWFSSESQYYNDHLHWGYLMSVNIPSSTTTKCWNCILHGVDYNTVRGMHCGLLIWKTGQKHEACEQHNLSCHF